MSDRPSKKLFITVICVQAVIGMAEGEQDKLKYAIIIGIMFLIYKIAQTLIDWSKNGKEEESEESN